MRLQLAPHPDVEGVTSVVLVGELDYAGAPRLRGRLDAEIAGGARRLLIDLSDATFIDSTMIGVIFYAARRVEALGGGLAVVCPDPGLRRTFEMVSLDRLFTVTGDAAAATSALAGRSG